MAMTGFPQRITAPFDRAFAITPSDIADVTVTGCQLRIGTAGDGTLRVDLSGGDDSVNFVGVPVGIFPIKVDRVHDTGTGVSNIHGIYHTQT